MPETSAGRDTEQTLERTQRGFRKMAAIIARRFRELMQKLFKRFLASDAGKRLIEYNETRQRKKDIGKLQKSEAREEENAQRKGIAMDGSSRIQALNDRNDKAGISKEKGLTTHEMMFAIEELNALDIPCYFVKVDAHGNPLDSSALSKTGEHFDKSGEVAPDLGNYSQKMLDFQKRLEASQSPAAMAQLQAERKAYQLKWNETADRLDGIRDKKHQALYQAKKVLIEAQKKYDADRSSDNEKARDAAKKAIDTAQAAYDKANSDAKIADNCRFTIDKGAMWTIMFNRGDDKKFGLKNLVSQAKSRADANERWAKELGNDKVYTPEKEDKPTDIQRELMSNHNVIRFEGADDLRNASVQVPSKTFQDKQVLQDLRELAAAKGNSIVINPGDGKKMQVECDARIMPDVDALLKSADRLHQYRGQDIPLAGREHRMSFEKKQDFLDVMQMMQKENLPFTAQDAKDARSISSGVEDLMKLSDIAKKKAYGPGPCPKPVKTGASGTGAKDTGRKRPRRGRTGTGTR